MRLQLQPIRLATRQEEDGVLVFAEDRLVAVLSCLADLQEDLAGHWHLEAGLGPLADTRPPVFSDLDAAEAWIAARLEPDRRR